MSPHSLRQNMNSISKGIAEQKRYGRQQEDAEVERDSREKRKREKLLSKVIERERSSRNE